VFLDKNGLINANIFIAVAKDHEINLTLKDQNYLMHKLAFNSKVNYEEVIKDLALIFVENSAL